MSNETLIRAWKDPMFRDSLGADALASLPPNPAGLVELSDEDLGAAAGGATPILITIAWTLHTLRTSDFMCGVTHIAFRPIADTFVGRQYVPLPTPIELPPAV